MGDPEDLEGTLTLEGPLLEMVYAALCVARGENVVPRLETLGVYHDVFIRGEKGHVFCECDGESDISEKKIYLFRDEVLHLNTLLKAEDQMPVTEARLVVMLPRKDWQNGAMIALDEVGKEFEKNGIRLNVIEPRRLLYDLVSNSILGFVLLDNHILLVGPGHWAIRYNASVSRFMYGESRIDLDKFRQLPQSFIARDYWNERHKDIYAEYSEISQESLPEWFSWKFPERFGIRWKNSQQIAKGILKAYSVNGRKIVHTDEKGFISLRRLKKNSYYAANVVYHGEIVGAEEAVELDRELSRIVNDFRNSGSMDEELDFYFRIFADTITFSHMYWTKAKFKTPRGEVSYTEIHRGDDLLTEVLNSGNLGIKLDRNGIRLSIEEGPDILTLVRGSLQWESSDEGTYPATLKF